jgi:ABC-type glutathione transport system ATPase component
MSDEKGRVIAAFLRYFNDDPERAVTAIRQYTTRNSDAREKTAVPLGSEIISAKDVVKTYKVGRQKIEVLRGVSLSVRQREFVALTGASGSGKSTLLQLIGGLDKPTSGPITVNGQALSALSDRKLSQFRGRTIGFVFQSFYLQPDSSFGRCFMRSATLTILASSTARCLRSRGLVRANMPGISRLVARFKNGCK